MSSDRYDLERFVNAQREVFDQVLSELRSASGKRIGCGSSFRSRKDWGAAEWRSVTPFQASMRRGHRIGHEILGERRPSTNCVVAAVRTQWVAHGAG